MRSSSPRHANGIITTPLISSSVVPRYGGALADRQRGVSFESPRAALWPSPCTIISMSWHQRMAWRRDETTSALRAPLHLGCLMPTHAIDGLRWYAAAMRFRGMTKLTASMWTVAGQNSGRSNGHSPWFGRRLDDDDADGRAQPFVRAPPPSSAPINKVMWRWPPTIV